MRVGPHRTGDDHERRRGHEPRRRPPHEPGDGRCVEPRVRQRGGGRDRVAMRRRQRRSSRRGLAARRRAPRLAAAPARRGPTRADGVDRAARRRTPAWPRPGSGSPRMLAPLAADRRAGRAARPRGPREVAARAAAHAGRTAPRAWINADRVRLARTRWRVEIDRSARTVRVLPRRPDRARASRRSSARPPRPRRPGASRSPSSRASRTRTASSARSPSISPPTRRCWTTTAAGQDGSRSTAAGAKASPIHSGRHGPTGVSVWTTRRSGSSRGTSSRGCR